jgi:hypothetical protein
MDTTKSGGTALVSDANSTRGRFKGGAVFFRQVAKRGQRTDVAIHGRDAVADKQLLARLVFDSRLLNLERLLQFEAQRRFGGEHDVFVAGKG